MSLNSDSVETSAQIVRPRYKDLDIKASESLLALAKDLCLEGHREGGFFKETDRAPFKMESPYYPDHNKGDAEITRTGSSQEPPLQDEEGNPVTPTRNFSTLIYYMITAESPVGRLHRNHSRIIHILQKGRGQYVLIYPNGDIKSFKVGFNVAEGEVMQWVVCGGVYKASYLLPGEDGGQETSDDCLLISEVVVPGFEFEDHKFMEEKELRQLVGQEKTEELKWLL